MKRTILIFGIVISATLAFGILRREAADARITTSVLLKQTNTASNEMSELKAERAKFREAIGKQKIRQRQIADEIQFDPELADWLLATNYARVPEDLSPKLYDALGLQWNDSSNCVLVSKATLHKITVSWNDRGTNLLGDWVCGLLAITPDERRQIESACIQTRKEFTTWAKANLQRDGVSDEMLVRYTIPASPEFATSLTNDFESAINSVLGPERGQLLWDYEGFWFMMNLGSFGSVTNTLTIRQNPGNIESSLWYTYEPEGHGGPIPNEGLPGTFRNIFPGGWQEIARREGFELRKENPNQPKN